MELFSSTPKKGYRNVWVFFFLTFLTSIFIIIYQFYHVYNCKFQVQRTSKERSVHCLFSEGNQTAQCYARQLNFLNGLQYWV